MIPDEAVEAAADAMQQFALNEDRGGDHTWDDYAQRALEAAAPHMLAQAWDEAHFDAIGCDSTCCDFMHDAPKKDMNPYR